MVQNLLPPGSEVTLNHFDNGWFSSNVAITVTLPRGFYETGGLRFTGSFNIQHGPLIFTPGKSIQLATYTAAGTIHFTHKSRYTFQASSEESFDGKNTFTLKGDNLNLSTQSHLIHIKRLTGRYIFARNDSQLKAHTVITNFTLRTRTPNGSFRVTSPLIKIGGHFTRNKRWSGTQNTLIPSLTLRPHGQATTELKGLSLHSIIGYHSNLLSYQFTGKLDTFKQPHFTLSPVSLRFTLHNANSTAISKLARTLFQQRQQKFTPQRFEKSILPLVMKAFAGAKLNLQQLRIKNGQYKLEIKGQFQAAKLPQTTHPSVSDSAITQLKQSHGKLELNVSSALYQLGEQYHYRILKQANKRQHPRIIPLYSKEGLLGLLFEQHIFLKVKTHFHSTLSYRHHNFKVNGQNWAELTQGQIENQSYKNDLNNKQGAKRNDRTTLYKLKFSNGYHIIAVKPRAKVNASVYYQYNHSTNPDHAISQILVGLIDYGPVSCIYDGTRRGNPHKTIRLTNGNITGLAHFRFTAPSKPGEYSIRFRDAQALDCKTALEHWWAVDGTPPAKATIGYLIVK